MKTLAITTQKGGSGKTTIATGLAVTAEQKRYRSVILDLDPQASACFWNDNRAASTPAVADCLPARLASNLAKIDGIGCDLAVLDCPAVHKDIAGDAMKYADFVLIPTRADMLDIASMMVTVDLAKRIGRPFAVLLNFCPPSGPEVPAAKEIVNGQNLPLCPVELSQLKAFPRAQQTGEVALETEPKSKAADQLRALFRYVEQELNLKGDKHRGTTK